MNGHALLLAATDRLGRALARVGLTPRVRGLDDARLVFYHGVGDNSAPCLRWLDDELDAATFERHLERLARRYELVSMSEIVAPHDGTRAPPVGFGRRGQRFSTARRGHRPACSISFDDGLSSVYSHAFPLLAARRIPFSVYVNTSTLDNADLLWQHRLGYLLSTLGPRATVRALEEAFDGRHPPVPAGIDGHGLEHLDFQLMR